MSNNSEENIRARLSANASDFDEVISEALQLIVNLKIRIAELSGDSGGDDSVDTKLSKSKLLVIAEKEVTSEEAKIEINNARVTIRYLLKFSEEDEEKIRKDERENCLIGLSKEYVEMVKKKVEKEKEGTKRKKVGITVAAVATTITATKNNVARAKRYNRTKEKKPKSGHMYIYEYTYRYKGASVIKWRFLYKENNRYRCKTCATIEEALKERDEYLGGVKID